MSSKNGKSSEESGVKCDDDEDEDCGTLASERDQGTPNGGGMGQSKDDGKDELDGTDVRLDPSIKFAKPRRFEEDERPLEELWIPLDVLPLPLILSSVCLLENVEDVSDRRSEDI